MRSYNLFGIREADYQIKTDLNAKINPKRFLFSENTQTQKFRS